MNPDNQITKKIAIIGLPNTGKSQVFNNLTRQYTLVANYPLTTVDTKKVTCSIKGLSYEVIDTPGMHCLYIHSEEENIVRDMLFAEKPDVIVQCVEARRLKHSLVLTLDLLELGVPLVISLNAVDETTRRGILIDANAMSRRLGVSVIESIAIKGVGTEELIEAIERARPGSQSLQYGEEIEAAISSVESALPADLANRRKIASLLLMGDPFIEEALGKGCKEEAVRLAADKAATARKDFNGTLGHLVSHLRSAWIDKLVKDVTKKGGIALGDPAKRFAELSRHPIFGIPILASVLLFTYLAIVKVSGAIESMLRPIIVEPTVSFVIKVLHSGFWSDLLVGDYGLLTLGLFNAIVTILPILSVFFLIFGLLEDIGYIPNACLLTKNIFEKIGLTGKAALPIVLGFGCKTMATLVARSLSSRKERYIAIFLIAFAIPCSAQLGIMMGISGRVGFPAFLIASATLVLAELTAGLMLNGLIKTEESCDYIQELPDIRVPNIKAIMIKTGYRIRDFLTEAAPIFLIGAMALFFANKTGILGLVNKGLSPIVTGLLGLPIKMTEVLILAMASRGVAGGLLLNIIDKGMLDYRQCIVGVVVTGVFIPCFANIAAMCKMLGNRAGILMAAAITVSGIMLAGALNWILILTIGR
jgi:ferrous iron transport protein B